MVLTTWNFLEKSLVNAQYITVSGNGKVYVVKGIVTINPNVDLALIKVENTNSSIVKIGDYKKTNISKRVFHLMANKKLS